MKFHANSGLKSDDLKRGVDYACIYVRHSTGRPVGAPRPLKGIYEPALGNMMLVDPTMPDDMIRFDQGPRALQILGLWEGPCYPLLPSPFYLDQMHDEYDLTRKAMTWAGYAAHQLGQVLRQNELAERLSDFGIERSPEQYIEHLNRHHHVRRNLTLTYDELDQLLRAAGI